MIISPSVDFEIIIVVIRIHLKSFHYAWIFHFLKLTCVGRKVMQAISKTFTGRPKIRSHGNPLSHRSLNYIAFIVLYLSFSMHSICPYSKPMNFVSSIEKEANAAANRGA